MCSGTGSDVGATVSMAVGGLAYWSAFFTMDCGTYARRPPTIGGRPMPLGFKIWGFQGVV